MSGENMITCYWMTVTYPLEYLRVYDDGKRNCTCIPSLKQ